MKTLAIIISMMTLITFNSLGQNTDIKGLFDKPETRNEIFNTIMNSHELMTDFIKAANGNEHAMMMMKENNQMMGQNGKMEMKGEHQMMDDGNMMGMMKDNPEMMQKMMGSGNCPMYGQMVNQKMPIKKYMMMVEKLPDMQEQLSLSDEQVIQMIDLQTAFKKQQVDYQADLTKKQMQMQKMLKNNAAVADVKKQMKQCADTKVDMKVAAYETAGKMKALLTDEQKDKLQKMMTQQGGMMQGQGGMMNQGSGQMMQKNNQ